MSQALCDMLAVVTGYVCCEWWGNGGINYKFVITGRHRSASWARDDSSYQGHLIYSFVSLSYTHIYIYSIYYITFAKLCPNLLRMWETSVLLSKWLTKENRRKTNEKYKQIQQANQTKHLSKQNINQKQ